MSFESKNEASARYDLENKVGADEKKIQELEKQLITSQINARRAQENLYKAYQDLQARERAIQEIKNSLSFRIGWMITAPLRWIYDKISGEASSRIAGAVSTSHPLKEPTTVSEESFFQLLSQVKHYDLAQRLDFANHSKQYFSSIQEVTYPLPPTLLFVAPNVPAFDLSSGDKRLFRILSLLSETAAVYLFTLGERPKKYVKALQEKNIKVVSGEDFNQLRKYIPYADALIFSWYYTLFDNFELTKLFPEAKVIVDSVDVHWLREFRSLEDQNAIGRERAGRNKEKEILAYKAANQVWAVTAQDRREILSEIPDIEVAIVSNVHRMDEQGYSDNKTNTILFFGGYQHEPNLKAVKILAEQIFPLIQSEISTAKLLIAGSKAPPEVIALGKKAGVEYLGFVEEAEIQEVYRRSQLTIIPLLAGAGIKGKICEAVAHGLPVITNEIGNEGIELEHLEEGIIVSTPEQMARYAIRALKGDFNLKSMSERACLKLRQLVSPEIVKENALHAIFPAVSICIVTWNRKELLEQCINSIFQHTLFPNFRILVHSNGCTDGTQEYLWQLAQKDARVEPILSDSNEVFVRPNNRMMERYPESDVVLLNNDVEVSPGWLMGLYRAAYLSDEIGISGAKLLYPDGSLQEFGAELYANGSGRNIGKFRDPTLPEFNRLTECGYVSGCAMYIKRSTIEKIGTFDDQFHPCYCEDSDLCYTAREHGLVTVVTPDSVVYHFEGATSGTDTSSGYKAYQEANMEKFLKKHRGKPNGIDWGNNN